MSLDVRSQTDLVIGVEDHGSIDHVGETGGDEGEQQGDTHEVHQHLPHRQGEDEERGVLVEERVGVAEVAAIQEEEHLLPAPAIDEAKHDGDRD